MSIINRRNAMLGWLTWRVAKRVAARKARAVARIEEGKPRKRLIIPLLAAVGAVLFFWQRKGDDEAPPAGE